MKKYTKFIYATLVISVASLGVFTASNLKAEGLFSIVLENIESLARGEIPEVEITCGSSDHTGRCWAGDCEPFYTPFGFAKAWDCFRATGNPDDVCVQDAPC